MRLRQVFHVSTDADYVADFQELSRVHIALRKEGPSLALLLRRAQLERAMGNHGTSLEAVLEAQALSPDHLETLYELGVSYFCLAMVEAGALPVGPRPAIIATRSVRDLLGASLEAFTAVLERNPQDDEAARNMGILAELLGAAEDDLALRALLQER